jgi:drug/metabolite transporter (DMT)-like permease
MTGSERQRRFRVILAFALVYILWGSTYLAIRITDEHIPPAMMCGTRFLIAGPIMLGYCALTGRRVLTGIAELGKLALIGILLLTGGNLVLAWAEVYVPSGLSALIIAITPLWFLIIDTWILRGDRISRRGLIGLGLGAIGMFVLLWPQLRQGGGAQTHLLHYLILPLGSLSWAIGSVLSKHWEVGVDSFAGTGWQMMASGVVNMSLALALHDPARTVWTARGVGALVYLIIGGSLVGFTSYIWLLDHAPTSKVSTYAYVNPMVAVFMGWLVLNERVDSYILVGSAIIVTAVALVTSAKVKARAPHDVRRDHEVPVGEAGD